jgi:glycosyltransferase involved in cell wall biosynthesis
MKTLVAIPAFNEEASIGAVLDELSTHHPLAQVVVIDDGSRDGTYQVVTAHGVRVIHHAVNLGVGAAMGTAFRFAVRNGYDAVVQVDADGQHRPEFLERLLAAVGDADIVIGSRFAEGGRYRTTGVRRGVQRVIAWVVSAYTRTRLTDVTSGFRIAGPRAVELFAVHYPVEWLGDTVESIVLASKQGLRVSEISVAMNERMAGLPSQNVFRALAYTGRIFLILLLAGIRKLPRGVQRPSSPHSSERKAAV